MKESILFFDLMYRKRQQYIMAKITVNGETQDVQLPLTLTQLIRQNNVLQPDMVSIQLNDRNEWDGILLQDGDTVDFLYFMGGGM